eukprot:2580190-Pleurochrysis_carterae.AAC.3
MNQKCTRRCARHSYGPTSSTRTRAHISLAVTCCSVGAIHLRRPPHPPHPLIAPRTFHGWRGPLPTGGAGLRRTPGLGIAAEVVAALRATMSSFDAKCIFFTTDVGILQQKWQRYSPLTDDSGSNDGAWAVCSECSEPVDIVVGIKDILLVKRLLLTQAMKCYVLALHLLLRKLQGVASGLSRQDWAKQLLLPTSAVNTKVLQI